MSASGQLTKLSLLLMCWYRSIIQYLILYFILLNIGTEKWMTASIEVMKIMLTDKAVISVEHPILRLRPLTFKISNYFHKNRTNLEDVLQKNIELQKSLKTFH